MKGSKISYQRTRLAPTPSGYLHLGNLASFILTVGLARRYRARILLRIDDLDRERYRMDYVEDIFSTLRFLGIPWDEGPRDAADFERNFSQMHRLMVYMENLDYLAAQDLLFACSCTRSTSGTNGDGCSGNCAKTRQSLTREDVSWRLKGGVESTNNQSIKIHELNQKINTYSLSKQKLQIQVRRKNGLPSYHLGSVSDDLYFGVDLIVRGEDLLESTLMQMHLASALNRDAFEGIVFVHHPLVVGSQGEKLSKTAGSESIYSMRKEGLDVRAIFNRVLRSADIEGQSDNWEDCFSEIAKKWGFN
jgi:glutamyl-tRNA synthetase